MKRFLILLLTLSLCLSFCACGNSENESSSQGETQSQDSLSEAIKAVYIPLDNRPVNYDRVSYLAEASGIKLVMPDEALVSNTMGDDYDQGNPKEIFDWLKNQSADYYIISLDMLFSGGLVGSRAPFDDTDDSIANLSSAFGEYTLSQTEEEIIDYVIELSKTKKVVLLDTVMRLASTVNYGGLDMNLYTFFRNRYASVERKQLYDNELTVENIVSGYKYDKDGQEITAVYGGKDYTQTVEKYLRGRERKLVLSDKLYSACGDDIIGLFVGVDDSTPNTNIQTNEIRYLNEKLINDRENFLLFAGADELGLMGISAAATDFYGEITMKLSYFGNGEEYVADDYDPGTLKESMLSHIDAVGGRLTEDNADIELLVLTRSAASGSDAVQHQKNVNALIEKLEYNLENNIPTCVIDASSYSGYGALAQGMLDKKLDIGEILGFSAWNTVGNAVGIALSNATARFTYLKNSENITEESHKGFMKTIAFSHVKDTAYKKFGNLPFEGSGTFDANYKIFLEYSQNIAESINNSSIFVSSFEQENKYDITLSNLYWPWNRNFEANFNVEAVPNGESKIFQ